MWRLFVDGMCVKRGSQEEVERAAEGYNRRYYAVEIVPPPKETGGRSDDRPARPGA